MVIANQILSPRFLSEFTGPIVNIHDTFRPALVGANPHWPPKQDDRLRLTPYVARADRGS
jgi:formyltetrahydrofolate hydrolase